MRTILGLVVVLAVGGVAADYYWHASFPEPPKFRTLPVTRGDLAIYVSATGQVQAMEQFEVGAQVLGRIKSFGPDLDHPGTPIDYNSRVKKGQVLARLDDLLPNAALDSARATVDAAEADLMRAETHQRQAKREYERAEKLRDTNSVAEYENVVAAYDMAQAERAICAAKLKEAKVAMETAQINVGYTTITSPVDGVVIQRCVNVDQTVVPSLQAPRLFLLAKDLARMRVLAAVNEADLGDIFEGQKVLFKVDAYRDQAFTGTVSQIRLDATMSSSVITYTVVVDVDNTNGKLKPYMTANVQFEVAHHKGVILVSNQALRWRPTWEQISPAARTGLTQPKPGDARPTDEKEEQDDESTELKVEVDSPTLWEVADDGLVRPIPVKLGLSDGVVTEIVGGKLQAGLAVVINAVRESKPDFVSNFVSKVTKIKKQP